MATSVSFPSGEAIFLPFADKAVAKERNIKVPKTVVSSTLLILLFLFLAKIIKKWQKEYAFCITNLTVCYIPALVEVPFTFL